MLYRGSTLDMAANFVWFLSVLWGQSTACNHLEVDYLTRV